jgi:hypothetical protein
MINGLFDIQFRMDKIDKNGDPLVALAEVLDWELFRNPIETMRESLRDDARKTSAGRKLLRGGVKTMLFACNRMGII